MTDLATHQRALRDLITGAGEPAPGADPYLDRVVASPALDQVRAIGDSWRRHTLPRTCPLTWRALDRRGGLEDLRARFARRPGLPPYLAARALIFLEMAAAEPDPVVAAVARFEHSLRRAATAPPERLTGEVVIDWPAEPGRLVRALIAGAPLPVDDPPDAHRSRAAACEPAELTVTRVTAPEPEATPGS